jgi:hypothetical protein
VIAALDPHESPIFLAFRTPDANVAKVDVEGSNPFSRSTDSAQLRLFSRLFGSSHFGSSHFVVGGAFKSA